MPRLTITLNLCDSFSAHPSHTKAKQYMTTKFITNLAILIAMNPSTKICYQKCRVGSKLSLK